MKVTVSCLLVTAVCTAIAPAATAQVAPVCREVAADAEGDGFGWQDNASCIITMESAPAPVFTNLETKEFVNITRAYWNAPADLYNKTITCIASRYNGSTGAYVPDNAPGRETHYSFHYTHLPLTTTAPYTGTVKSEHIVTAGPNSDYYYNETFTSWSMDNGIYTGGAPFTESPYVEIVTEPSTGEKVIRTWRRDSEFVQCSAVPTGVPPVFADDSSPESGTTVDDSNGSSNTENTGSDSDVQSASGESGAESANVEVDTGQSDSTDNSASTNNNSTIDETDDSTIPADPLLNNDATAPTSELSNPFGTSSGGSGSIGIWLLSLLAVFGYKTNSLTARAGKRDD